MNIDEREKALSVSDPELYVKLRGPVDQFGCLVHTPVQALQQEVFDFAEATFGPGREDAAWKKLFEELGEVLKSPRDPAEWGDVFILLFDLAAIYGVSVDEATRTKLAIISNRVWEKTLTGTFQHVPGAVKDVEVFPVLCVFVGGPLVPEGAAFWRGEWGSPWKDEVPSAFCPPGHVGPGCYVLTNKQRAFRSGPCTYTYDWDPTMEVPF